MPVEPKVSVRKDTRGLPEGYDPHKLYEYRRDLIVDKATGLESFLYKYIPWSVIKSFAIAIDPFHQFKVAPGVITPANRVKYRQTALFYRNGILYKTQLGGQLAMVRITKVIRTVGIQLHHGLMDRRIR